MNMNSGLGWTFPTFVFSSFLLMSACTNSVAVDHPPNGSCEGKICNTPPSPRFINEYTLRRFVSLDICNAGVCLYAPNNDACTDRCYGAEINPTGNPIGGRWRYTNIVSAVEADFLVHNKTELLDALQAAEDGDIIYVDETVQIDLTGCYNLPIKGGITLASGRGLANGPGALIFSTIPSSSLKAIFSTAGPHVRITGLRLQGPDPFVGDREHDAFNIFDGIVSHHPFLEVDNCEISGFSHSGVFLTNGSNDSYIHHNTFHHNTRIGLGYGVCMLNTDKRAVNEAIIEANLFYANRHDVTASGRPGESYEARFNIMLPPALDHRIDMHGAGDFEKNDIMSLWSFEEGSGSMVKDVSVSGGDECTLINFDPAITWTQGAFAGQGLLFDGLDDYVSCACTSDAKPIIGTFSFMFRALQHGIAQNLIFFDNNARSSSFIIRLTTLNQLQIVLVENALEKINISTVDAVNDDEFHNVVVVQDGTAMKIFLDGKLKTMMGTNGGGFLSGLGNCTLTLGGGNGQMFKGVLDDIYLYNKALSASDALRHAQGYAGMAGEKVLIHHNSFYSSNQDAICIRGRPRQRAIIHHNWFAHADQAEAVTQHYVRGNIDVYDNHYGKKAPLGSHRPIASFTANPLFGIAPLDISFDASASKDMLYPLVGYAWDFGDGSSHHGRYVTHKYHEAGRYLVTLMVLNEKGVPAVQRIPVVVLPAVQGIFLSLWTQDSYRGMDTNVALNEVLVNNQSVWQDNAAGNERWQHLLLDVTTAVGAAKTADLTFKTTRYGTFVKDYYAYIDDVEVFGAVRLNGDFEPESDGGLWTFQATDNAFNADASGTSSYTGTHALELSQEYNKAVPNGSSAQVTTIVRLPSDDVILDWRMDEGTGSLIFDYSQHGNNGRIVTQGEHPVWSPGAIAWGLSLDGIADTIDVSRVNAAPTHQGAVELFVNASVATGKQTILALNQGLSNSWVLSLTEAGKLRLSIVQSGLTVTDVSAVAPIEVGTFQHVVISHDGSKTTLYVNGLASDLVGSNGTAWFEAMDKPTLKVGTWNGTYFNGIIDELRIYNRPLLATEVKSQAESIQSLGIWDCDDGPGLTLSDSSSFHCDGTLNNMDTASSRITGGSGKALHFDGQDDFVNIKDAHQLATAQGSIEFWFKSEKPHVNMDLINIFEDGYDNYLLIRRNRDNKIHLVIEDENITQISIQSNVTIADALFHHVVITQDGRGARIYIDGLTSAIYEGQKSAYWMDHLTKHDVWIGKGHWYFLQGAIDNLRICRRALRSQEIGRNYMKGR